MISARQPTESEKIFTKDVSDKRLVCKIYKALYNPTPKTQIIRLKNGQKTRTDVFPKKTYRWLTDTWKDAQRHSSPGKCSSKPQWDITSQWDSHLRMAKVKNARNNSCWQGCGEKGIFVHCWRECELVRPLWKLLKKSKIKLSADPATPLLGIYLKTMKTLTQKDICTSMVAAALFTVAKLCKQPKCPLIDEWMKMYIYAMDYYSAIKKEWSLAICNDMDGSRGY